MTSPEPAPEPDYGHYLSCARRFVIADRFVVADGVQFARGPVVLLSRRENGIELYPTGLDELPPVLRAGLHWIDALRPDTCPGPR